MEGELWTGEVKLERSKNPGSEGESKKGMLRILCQSFIFLALTVLTGKVFKIE